MTTVRAPATLHVTGRVGAPSRLLNAVVLPVATVLTLLAAGLLILLLPLYVHAALDAAGAAQRLGVTATEARALSDMTIAELLVGPGTFAFAGPDGAAFYDATEAGHLRDVRLVLYGFLLVAGASAALVGAVLVRRRSDPEAWRALARGAIGLVVAVVAVGIFAALAFDVAFELFHRLLFPGGNWSFDPQRQRLVQLYPLPFWQLTTAAMGILAASAGLLGWAFARRRAAWLEAAAGSTARRG